MNKKAKIIAFYLPQFHTIPENDAWWGKGFTEWVNTKKSKPLFFKHNQPREPLDDNYYDLLDKDTLKWQAGLANKYGLYGFCFYHYWFGGKQLLEKPAELLLKDTDIECRYCFSWANESWVRTWDGKGDDVLIKQEYGDKEAWKEHFDYLLPFFNDERYIKIDGRPVLLIYRASGFKHFDDMFKYWNDLCAENELANIYIIETMNGFETNKVLKSSEACVEFEPSYTRTHMAPEWYNWAKRKVVKFSKGTIFDQYDILWRNIIKRKPGINKTFPGAFVDWDNSARRGRGSVICLNASPKRFKKYLGKQIKNALDNYKSEYIFLNAWNEWAEGTYLEPDKKHGFKYLEAVKSAIDGNYSEKQ